MLLSSPALDIRVPAPLGAALALFAALALPAAALAQSDSVATLRSFERDLTAPQPADTASRPERDEGRRRHRNHHEDPDTGGFFSNLFGDLVFGIFKAAGEGYASLPNPNYGPYPYSGISGFYAHGPGNATYVTVGCGYERTHHNIPSIASRATFSAAALVIDAYYQQYRESSDRLHLSAVRIGARKAPGGAVLWRNHAGWRHLEGSTVLNGVLFGTGFEVFPGGNTALGVSYDIDLFPKYGTVFHDLTGSCSYFLGRAEFSLGYHGLITYKGTSLHGPFAGVSWHF